MAFYTDYAALRAAVPSFIDWSDSTTTHVDNLITIAEKKVYRLLRTRANEQALSATITSNVVAVPSDYEEMKSARIDASPVRKLTRKSVEFVYEHFSDRSVTGNELYFAREGSNFIFAPAGADGGLMKGIYYRSGTLMASGIIAGTQTAAGTINSIFSAHPDLFLMACASEASVFIGMDQRIQIWEGKFQQLLQQANQQAKNEDWSGSTIAGHRG